jgi:nucleotide-binding universal stress UspA family protein
VQINVILCPIDFSEFSVAAYRYALSVAEHYQAKVVCLHVVELQKYPYADYGAYETDFAKFCHAISEGGRHQLREFVKRHTGNSSAPDVVVQQGNSSDSILSFVESQNIELIVMGTHGRRGFDRMVLGSTTDRIMRKAACPVLVVSNPSHNAMCTGPDGRHRLERILYCTDFSHNSSRALEYAVSVAAEYGAELTLLHVTENVPDLSRGEKMIASRSEQLEKLIPESKRQNLQMNTAVRFGRPFEEINRYAADSQVSMIIMTARGGDALDRAVFGSTTYRVIQLGTCPVLAIHTDKVAEGNRIL